MTWLLPVLAVAALAVLGFFIYVAARFAKAFSQWGEDS